jgi:hypothetical protein
MRVTGIDFKAILAHSYDMNSAWNDQETRDSFLSNYIFGFSTYDSEMDELFVKRAVEVGNSIAERSTFEYIKDRTQYEWFVSMCHMEFFKERICWGTSIRAAFWNAGSNGLIEYETCGLWIGEDQVTETMEFTLDEWNSFIAGIAEFAEVKP